MMQLHKTEPIFVGRRDELKHFDEILASPKGQAVLVVGPQGMGKTLLVNRMARIAQAHPDLACDHVRFEVTDTDEPDAVMELMIDRAFDAAGQESSVGGGERRTRQYLALIKLLPKGDALGDLIQSLRRDPKKNARQQLGEKLECISRRMKKNARAIFVIDPEKYMTPRGADPTGVADAQWRRLCDEHKENAVKLFEAYAVLEVAVPDEVVETVSGVDTSVRKALGANAFVAGLLRPEPDGTRIYHSLLADHIHEQISETHARAYHTRAMEVYRRRLTADVKPDALAAVRLPEHVLAVEGPKAFVDSFASESFQPLLTLGLLDAALAMSHLALEDYVSPGTGEESTIADNLGLIYRRRGDLDEAEKMHRKALEIEKKFGRFEGMSIAYGNLGTICLIRDDLNEAEKMYRKSLEIDEKLGQLEDMATLYGNLGLVFPARGDLDEAEKMHRKGLEIDEKLGRIERMGNHYGNLGVIYTKRGNLDEGEKMLRKSLEIDKKLGRHEGMATIYGNLGLIFKTRGDFDDAEKMHRQSLEIDTKLGRLEGMANQYGNLGNIFETRGELCEARKLWVKARDLYAKVGIPHMVEKVQGLLDDLPDAGEDRS